MGALNYLELGTKRPLRVAAYCRISKEEEEAEGGSYANQKQYMLDAINDHPGWELAGIFGDYATTGTKISGRYDFQRMIQKAEAGRIDYIITKSISRFSRSATHTLAVLRKLTALGVGVYFLEQDLDSLNVYGELIIAALSSIAEMESESISQNVTTVFNAMNQKGTPLRRTSYGFKRDGLNWVVVPKEAIRVKLAFLMAANGFSFAEIAKRLNQLEAIDQSGREWNGKMVKRTLMSETYIGDILTNKNCMIQGEDGRKQVRNTGIDDQYYIKNHHNPIVGKPLYKRIREMAENEKLAGQRYYNGMGNVGNVAKCDHLLDGVKKYMPRPTLRPTPLQRATS